MGKDSAIEWTHHTFNPWWGCTKISPACNNCYAEKWSKRLGSKVWGSSADRRFFGEKHWGEPLLWNREAEKNGNRKRVFCASMADVFEDRTALDDWRTKLWELISETPWLDWLLLTKRTENIRKMTPWNSSWPSNIWLGATIENQELAERRIPELIKYKAKVKFISSEPLLEGLDVSQWLRNDNKKNRSKNYIDWVIAGGESGYRARPTHPDWLRILRDQCSVAGVPFHFKQWGCWKPLSTTDNENHKTLKLKSSKGKIITLVKKDKKSAGRELDGRTWDGVPEI